ncbi:LPS export ABC transporter ATP-binding protein [Aliarcobacter cryaerophilus]|jgi:lipopolysaccharide export system ATP-binding protein|uniref:LPS export ABC transporter ATP-binding protein n=1 Tax=Aliarcobacter cryaerophilus TaxID=28198 RepID=UPI00112F198D|nr:LPS export ABC transporter ATP-binding protein [Aliarcobacter cryaerophilus]MCT7482027.1 LPS export ABC transporter ATP-binding protein [Aliarcobacter cryaerophilus]MCT7483137.1 LPS export ABC transporter ATP-binding protein [Aliarcobacter cryaerophilus]MCT7484966.1 LPS export ABC transporter ATP-binding protein [Aliarcobacter cryaerophilus]MCT7489864.1 LPS export ABC transporter ATP-binding protein [Aliarcobacter cryaerophilus]MCT7501122.1 LPS export ABC transporter ATP-binding protein [Al
MNNLRIVDIKKSIKKTEILHGISLEINSGEIVGLLGPNGAGKTTTFYTVCGLVKPTSGKVFFDDEDITAIPLHKRALKGIGYLPQESSIFKDLSVEENLLLAAEIVIKDKEEQNRRVEELLELLDIEPIRQRKGISLSGGERRRTEIARALVSKPKFLLLDEPFAGVDPIAVKDIQDLINELTKIGIGVLITDHNVRETLQICHRAYVMKSGSLLASGTSEEIKKDINVKEHYLGEDFNF